MTERSFLLLNRTLFFLAMLVISYLAFASPGPSMPTTGWDKLNHVLAFFVLLGLLDNAYPAMRWLNKLLLLLAYGVAIECWQGVLPARELSLLDVVADGVGLLLYWLIRPLLIKWQHLCVKREMR